MGRTSHENGRLGEQIAMEFLKKRGYWVHDTGRNSAGSQPVDLIAIKKGSVWLLDAKFVRMEDSSFRFTDVQPNQVTTMRYAKEFAGIENLGFFIVFDRDRESPRFMPYSEYIVLSAGFKSVKMSELRLAEKEIT